MVSRRCDPPMRSAGFTPKSRLVKVAKCQGTTYAGARYRSFRRDRGRRDAVDRGAVIGRRQATDRASISSRIGEKPKMLKRYFWGSTSETSAGRVTADGQPPMRSADAIRRLHAEITSGKSRQVSKHYLRGRALSGLPRRSGSARCRLPGSRHREAADDDSSLDLKSHRRKVKSVEALFLGIDVRDDWWPGGSADGAAVANPGPDDPASAISDRAAGSKLGRAAVALGPPLITLRLKSAAPRSIRLE